MQQATSTIHEPHILTAIVTARHFIERDATPAEFAQMQSTVWEVCWARWQCMVL